MSFKGFLLNEERGYLGHKVSDVLTSMQDLQNDMADVGARHLTRLGEEIVNRIRKIIHGQWAARNHKHLEELQKIAVAIQKTIDDKGDLKEILPAATQAVQDLSGKLGVKVNDLQAPEAPEMEGEPVSQDDFELTGDGPQQGQDQQPLDPNAMPAPDPMAGQMPQAGQQPPAITPPPM